jgi:hypothetical protein
MMVDQLHHEAQRGYRVGDRSIAVQALSELEEIEARGCRVRVFRGRTLLVFGDFSWDTHAYKEALEFWMKGLLIVALHGDSRTNVELFSEMLDARIEKMKVVLADRAERNRWKREWRSADTTAGYRSLWGAGGAFA